MKYTELGNTGISISKLCLGGMSFGKRFPDFHQWVLNERETDEVVRQAVEAGINFFDTANVYSHGTSEEYMGKALKKYLRREEAVIATKVYFNEGHLSKEAILREADLSLKRLGTDYIDLYIIHRFDYGTPIEETMEALDSLVKAGKVRALGASAMYGYQFMNMQHAAMIHGWTPFVSMQNHYNLLYREDEREMIPICRQQDVSLTPYSPLAGGRLTRLERDAHTLRNETDETAREKYDGTMDQDYQIVQRVHEIAEKHHAAMSQIALAWLWEKGAASPIIGVTKMKHLEEAVQALDIKLTAEDIAYLEACYRPHAVVGAL